MNERSIGQLDIGSNVEAIVLFCYFFGQPGLKINDDAFVKSQNFDGKEKSSSSRRVNPEEGGVVSLHRSDEG